MNLELINKWLDKEYGCSYTRLEELHDFVVEQDMKHQEKADKEIDKLNNDIKVLLKENENKEKVIIKQDNIINDVYEFVEWHYKDNQKIFKNKGIGLNYPECDYVLDKLKELKKGE